MNKIVAIHKPKGITSHDVIYALRRITGIKKIGHAGTLDPLASGVLVVAIGRDATKTIDQYMKQQKEYVAKIFFGAFSETDDEEGKKTFLQIVKQPTKKEIEKVLEIFIGDTYLQPPTYSAIKIKGVPAYKLARKGKQPKLEPRKSHIDSVKLISYVWPNMSVKLETGSGVYVRSVARKIGGLLSCGAYLTDLTRTWVGLFSIQQAQSIEEFAKTWKTF